MYTNYIPGLILIVVIGLFPVIVKLGVDYVQRKDK